MNHLMDRPLVLAFLAVLFVSGCVTPASRDTDAFSEQSWGSQSIPYSVELCLPSKVVVGPAPPVQLQQLAFLFEKNGQYCVNLTCSQDVDNQFSQRFPNSPAYGFGTRLTSEQQTWVLQRCKEKIGDSYSSVSLIDWKNGFAQIRGISGYAEAGNGDIGFIGDLDTSTSRSASRSDDIFGERIVGFAFPASTPTSVRFKPTVVVGMKELERIQTVLRSELEDATCHVLKAVRNPDDGAILAVAEHERSSSELGRGASVFYLMRVSSALRVVPFTNVPYAIDIRPEMGFPVDIYPGCRENTRIFFLFDIDHDGRGELLVSCREGFIFKVVDLANGQAASDRPSLVPVRNFYYGMRE